jgi:Ubiquitin carboxyl-terminal hydrolase
LLLHLKRFLVVERTIETEGKENESPNIPRRTGIEYVFLKSRAAVSIPSSLTLQPFEKKVDDPRKVPINAIPNEYSIKSIVHHIGSRASSGHYTADALRARRGSPPDGNDGSKASAQVGGTDSNDHSDPVWISYDDDMTNETTLQKILNNRYKQESAYMILYSLE